MGLIFYLYVARLWKLALSKPAKRKSPKNKQKGRRGKPAAS